MKWFFTGAWEWVHDYGAILFGLLLGTVAHYGRKLANKEPIERGEMVGYLMQLGVIGLLASVATRELGMVDADTRALTTAIMAMSAQEIVRHLQEKGWLPTVSDVVYPRNKD